VSLSGVRTQQATRSLTDELERRHRVDTRRGVHDGDIVATKA
jgi:hypothetical protein